LSLSISSIFIIGRLDGGPVLEALNYTTVHQLIPKIYKEVR